MFPEATTSSCAQLMADKTGPQSFWTQGCQKALDLFMPSTQNWHSLAVQSIYGVHKMVETPGTIPAIKGLLIRFIFATDSIGYAVGGNTIAKSTDQGSSWSSIYTTPALSNTLWRVRFISPLEGIAVGSGGIILKTIDGGVSWQQKNSGVSGTLYDVEYYTSSIVYAVGSGDAILRSADGGETWSQETINVQSGQLFYKITVKPNGIALVNSVDKIVYQDSCGGTANISAFDPDSICHNAPPVGLPAGFPSGGTYSGTGVTGVQFDPNGLAAGLYNVYYTYTNATCTTVDSTVIQVLHSQECDAVWSVDEWVLGQLKTYPNPVLDRMFLEVPDGIQRGVLDIKDMTGRTVITKDVSGRISELDLGNLTDGMYLIMLNTDKGIFYKQIVVE